MLVEACVEIYGGEGAGFGTFLATGHDDRRCMVKIVLRSSNEDFYADGASVRRSIRTVHDPFLCKGGWWDREEEPELLM